MQNLIKKATKFLFFTGKGGVGKTSMSCAISLALAKNGKKVLLISTDPASNLDEVLNTPLKSTPTPINEVENLYAMNINPITAAMEYKEKMIAPYIGLLPKEAIEQMSEQLSGACSVEIAGFNEFSKYIGDTNIINKYDHIILDTAPTGHTLRLLTLPAAWNDFISKNKTGSSCLGPISGLSKYKNIYDNALLNLKDESKTLLVLVSRAEKLSFIEAEKTSLELNEIGVKNQYLIINGVFTKQSSDKIAQGFYNKSQKSLNEMHSNLKKLERSQIGFYPNGVVGINSLEEIITNSLPKESENAVILLNKELEKHLCGTLSLDKMIEEFEEDETGVIMTMGKGGVGKTTIASLIALKLAQKGHQVTLSTTDPAAHLKYIVQNDIKNLKVESINPKEETRKHIEEVIEQNEGKISKEDMQLLKEELNSPCTEEIAIFKAFAKTLSLAKKRFVVLDTAPTGHTLLLLDSSQAYHKEVLKNSNGVLDEELSTLLPKIKNPKFTKILITTLAEATPTHEAKALQEDLNRAGIKPFAWIINRSFALCKTNENLLAQKGLNELKYIDEIKTTLSKKCMILPWIEEELDSSNLQKLS